MKVKSEHAVSAYNSTQNIFVSTGAKDRETSDAVVREFPSVAGSKCGIVYSKGEKSITSAYVLDIRGDAKEIRSENLPKELGVIHNAAQFSAFLRQVYIRSVTLDNGEEKIYVEQTGVGGMPPKRSAESFDIAEIRTLIADGTRRIDERFGATCQEAIITVGITGAGKSTLLNLLFGVPLQAEISDKAALPIVAQPGNKLLFNASASFVSQTTIPQREDLAVADSSTPVTFVDCPGFGDTRGLKQEIVNAFCVKSLFPKIEKAKLLVVIPESAIETAGKGASIKDLVRDLHNIFGDFKGIKMNSIAVIFTNVRPEHTSDEIEASLTALAEAAQMDGDETLSDFCSGIKHIGIFHRPEIGPIDASCAGPILSMLNRKVKAMPVPDPSVSISGEARAALTAIINEAITNFETKIPAARISLNNYIEGLSNTGLNGLREELERASATGDKVEHITAMINEKLRENEIDFDAVTRVLDFVVSIDERIAGDGMARYGRAITTLAGDISAKVRQESEKRSKEEEAQRLKREAEETQKRLYELEYRKTWTTAMADIAKSTVTAVCSVGTAVGEAFAKRIETSPTTHGDDRPKAVGGTGSAVGGSGKVTSTRGVDSSVAAPGASTAAKDDARRKQFIEAATRSRDAASAAPATRTTVETRGGFPFFGTQKTTTVEERGGFVVRPAPLMPKSDHDKK